MKLAGTVAGLFFVLPFGARAGTISIDTSANTVATSPPQPGSLDNFSGSACASVGTVNGGCNTTVPPSTLQPMNSVTTPLGSAQSAAGGPTDLSQPQILNASGSMTATTSAAESAGYSFSTNPSGPVTSYVLDPTISINFAPGPLKGIADASTFQRTEYSGASFEYGQFLFEVNLTGTSNANFTLDAATDLMQLSATPGVSGSIELSSFYYSPTATISTSLLDYEFAFDQASQATVVTASSNTLGLALPGVGSGADFLVNVGPFETTLPSLGEGDVTGLKTFNQIGEYANLITPEPGTLGLAAGAGLVLILGLTVQRRRAAKLRG